MKYRSQYGKERTDLDGLHFGAPARLFRVTSKNWEGPFKFASKEGETVCVQLPHERRIFRSYVVKTVKADNPVKENGSLDIVSPTDENVDKLLLATSNQQQSFKEFRREELYGLMKAKVFEVVDKSSVPHGKRIYGTKWVEIIKKRVDSSTKAKSRLVAQKF